MLQKLTYFVFMSLRKSGERKTGGNHLCIREKGGKEREKKLLKKG